MPEAQTAAVETTTPEAIDPDQPVSIEIDGKTLTGVGETEDSLREGLPAVPETPVKSSKGRQRYSELTSERDQEREKRTAAERERDELKAKLEALSQAPQAPIAQPTPPAPVRHAPAVEPPPPQKFSFPTYAQAVETQPTLDWEDWANQRAEAYVEWKLTQVQPDLDARVRSGIEADRADQSLRQTVQDTWARGRSAYTDFDAMRASGPGSGIDLGPTAEQARLRVLAVLHAPHSEHLQYAIAKDASLAHRLAHMNDVEFGMAIAALAPTVPVASPASTGAAGSLMPPPPMQPVGSGSKTAVLSAADLAERAGEDYDASGFREQLRRERGRR